MKYKYTLYGYCIYSLSSTIVFRLTYPIPKDPHPIKKHGILSDTVFF